MPHRSGAQGAGLLLFIRHPSYIARLSLGRSLRDQIFFFFAKDRPKGPPTANRQLPSTANRHQPPTTDRHQPPPTANHDQPPTANHCQPPPTTNHQPPTAANHHQPPPTASCQLPTANRRQLPTANRHQPWLSTRSARGLFWENWFRSPFFFPLRTALLVSGLVVPAYSSTPVWTMEYSAVVALDPRAWEFWIAIGTGLGVDTLLPWQRVVIHHSWTYDGTAAGLADGGVYWSMVQTATGVRSGARTVLDTSPPAVLHRRLAVEAPHPSGTFLMNATATLCWRGMFTDAHTGIDAYDVALRTAAGPVAAYRRLATPCVNVSHGLASGARVTVDVTAYNGVGLSAAVAAELTVDLSPPVPPADFFYADPGGGSGSDSAPPVVAQVPTFRSLPTPPPPLLRPQ